MYIPPPSLPPPYTKLPLTHHDGEEHQQVEVVLEGAEEDDKANLNPRVEIDPPVRNRPQVLVVGTVLVRDEEQLDALEELHAVERGHAQVEDEAVEDGKWEEIEGPVGHDGETDEDGHNEQGHPLLPAISQTAGEDCNQLVKDSN